jgi:hypothetical protein
MLISKDYAILFLFAFLFTMLMMFIVASNIYANTPPLPHKNYRNHKRNHKRNNNNN